MIAASEKKTEVAAPPQTTVATSAQHPPSQPTANASTIVTRILQHSTLS